MTLKKAIVVQPRVCDNPLASLALHLSLRSIVWEYHMMWSIDVLSVHFLHALHNKQQFTFSACYHLVWPMWNQLLPGRSMQVHGVAKLVITLKVDSCNLQLFYSWSYDAKLIFQYAILAYCVYEEGHLVSTSFLILPWLVCYTFADHLLTVSL
jgi:hypothetical protein